MAAPGDILDGRYRLGPVLGRGGMADVYRAHDQVTGDDVAVKVLRASDPAADRWQGREQAALGRLDHPALVRLRATGVTDGRPYLVLDLVDGRPLADILRDGPLGAGRAAELGAHIAGGLAHAHAAGVIHRDVKPANILIDAAGRPHLADFGIARLSEVTTATAAGVVLGTAAYLAPEQVRAEPVGPPADIYALGVVLIECITGERCFPGSFQEAAMAHLTRPPAVPDRLPPGLRRALTDATALDPTRRPSATALAVALAGAATPPPTEVRSPTQVRPAAPAPIRRRRRRGTVVAAAVGSVVGITVALAAMRTTGASSPPENPPTTAPAAAPLSVSAAPTTTTSAAPTTSTTLRPTTTTTPGTTTTAKHKKKG
jgi:serine/threonine protein kinase